MQSRLATDQRDVLNRVKSIQVCNSQPIHLLGTLKGHQRDEMALHARFYLSHKRGEWYYPRAELVNFIAQTCLDYVADSTCDGLPN